MGLDIYAGTLTRYYSHNWKTAVQQWAEENGYTFNRITPDGEAADNEEEMSPAEIQAAVENWRDQILSAISQPGQLPCTPGLKIMRNPTTPTSPIGTPSALCCWWPPAIRTMSRCPHRGEGLELWGASSSRPPCIR